MFLLCLTRRVICLYYCTKLLIQDQPWFHETNYNPLTHWGRDKWTPFCRRHFKHIFFDENVWIPIKISLKFVPKGPINNIPALVQIMAWRRPGKKPLSEPMMINLPTHICITRPQWVNRGYETDGINNDNLHTVIRAPRYHNCNQFRGRHQQVIIRIDILFEISRIGTEIFGNGIETYCELWYWDGKEWNWNWIEKKWNWPKPWTQLDPMWSTWVHSVTASLLQLKYSC